MMKKRWTLLCLLIFALLLPACAGQGAEQGTAAGTDTPERDAISVPSSAAAEPALPESMLPESALSGEADAAEPEPAVHTLTGEEMAALWQQLDGIWRVNDPEIPGPGTEWLYVFAHYESGEFTLTETPIASDGGSQYINEVTEQNGSYTLYVYETWSLGYFNECEPDARKVITLSLQEDGTITIESYIPPRYGQEISRWEESWGEDIPGTHWRLATAEEMALMNDSETGYLTLENGDAISQSYISEPVRCHRETPEEENIRLNNLW